MLFVTTILKLGTNNITGILHLGPDICIKARIEKNAT